MELTGGAAWSLWQCLVRNNDFQVRVHGVTQRQTRDRARDIQRVYPPLIIYATWHY